MVTGDGDKTSSKTDNHFGIYNFARYGYMGKEGAIVYEHVNNDDYKIVKHKLNSEMKGWMVINHTDGVPHPIIVNFHCDYDSKYNSCPSSCDNKKWMFCNKQDHIECVRDARNWFPDKSIRILTGASFILDQRIISANFLISFVG